MRIFLYVIALFVVLLIIAQFFTIMSTKKTELQNYSVVHSGDGFEIRFYPSVTFATIYSEAKSYRDLSSPGFRKLAEYIFGGNNTATKISMTAPVQMDINDSLSEMSFVLCHRNILQTSFQNPMILKL